MTINSALPMAKAVPGGILDGVELEICGHKVQYFQPLCVYFALKTGVLLNN